MRSVVFILGGFVWAVCLGIARLVTGGSPSATIAATVAFVSLGFFAAAWNRWAGVPQAGYSFQKELPIFLLPVSAAVIVKWKFFSVARHPWARADLKHSATA